MILVVVEDSNVGQIIQQAKVQSMEMTLLSAHNVADLVGVLADDHSKVSNVTNARNPLKQLLGTKLFRKSQERYPNSFGEIDLVRQSDTSIISQYLDLYTTLFVSLRRISVLLLAHSGLTGLCIRPAKYKLFQSTKSLHSASIDTTPYLIIFFFLGLNNNLPFHVHLRILPTMPSTST